MWCDFDDFEDSRDCSQPWRQEVAEVTAEEEAHPPAQVFLLRQALRVGLPSCRLEPTREGSPEA
jgi:hypothetical protein